MGSMETSLFQFKENVGKSGRIKAHNQTRGHVRTILYSQDSFTDLGPKKQEFLGRTNLRTFPTYAYTTMEHK
jgi:hypothetical protein